MTAGPGTWPLRLGEDGRPIAVVAIGKVAEWITLAAMLTIIPRTLGPHDYGVFGVALGLVTLGSAGFALGGPAVMARFVAAAPAAGRAALARSLAFSALRWRASALALCTVLVVALIVVAPERFPPLTTSLVLAAVVVDAAATLAFQVALGLDRALLWSFRYPAQNLCVVVAAPLLYLALGVTGALLAIALGSLVALAIGVGAIHGHLRGARAPLPEPVRRFATLQALTGLCVQVLHRGGVVAVALLAASQAEAGFATLALGVAIALTYAVWQVFTVALPRLSVRAEENGALADRAIRRLAATLTTAVVPAAVLGAVLAEPMLRLLAGGRYVPGAAALALAMAAVPLAPVTGAVAAGAAIRLRPGARLASALVGVAVFIALMLVLVPLHGATGASAAFTIGCGAMAATGVAVFADVVDRRVAAAGLAATLLVGWVAVGR